MTSILVSVWLCAALSFYSSQKYNRSSFEALFASLSLLLHGALGALLVFGNKPLWFALVPVILMGVVVASAVSGNQATRQQNLFRLWLELQIGFVLTVLIHVFFYVFAVDVGLVVTIASLTLAVAANMLLFLHTHRYRAPEIEPRAPDKLPTVSLLIPARNEDHALKQALQAAVKSSYPRLEILVLDDCSHDKTPEIIRGFAHDGVRFIEGSPPPEDWLGKNYALEQLRQAANGEILLFCDVDVTFETKTIDQLVALMHQEELDMVSLLPKRSVFDFLPTLLRPLTDFLLSVLPFQLLDSRAAIGTCYAINAQTLKDMDGYSDVKNDIFPEFSFTHTVISNGRYKFYFGRELGVHTRKHFSSQEESLIRILFPAVNKDMLLSYASLLIGALVIWPYVAVFTQPSVIAFVACVTWSASYAWVVRSVHGRTALIAFVQFPFLVVHELVLLTLSMYKYLFARVIWKERNICMPALETTPRLPKID